MVESQSSSRAMQAPDPELMPKEEALNLLRTEQLQAQS